MTVGHGTGILSAGENAPIGVFDSGIGGLSILRALQAELPNGNLIYISDAGHAPYGERDSAHVLARSRALAAHLIGQGVQALVVACNTATAAAIDVLRAEYPDLPIVGVEPALKPAALLSRTRRVGVMATRSTLASERFVRLHQGLVSQAEFILQPCDGLADAIERGIESDDASEIIANCARHVGAMGQFGVKAGEMDTLVLGCTHYPFASEHLRALLGPQVQLVDTGAPVARQTRMRLGPSRQQTGARAATETGRLQLCTTGQTGPLQAAVKRWLQLDCDVDKLNV